MGKIPIFNIREAVEKEIRYELAEIVSRLTPTKPTYDELGRCYCDEMLLSHAKFCHNCGRPVSRK